MNENYSPAPLEESHEEKLKYSDIKITYVEHLSIINYLTKAIEDIIIKKIPLLKFPLLLIDIPLLFAVVIVNLERIIYTNTIVFLISYIKVDIRPITKKVKHVIPEGQREKLLGIEQEEEEYEEIEEETFLGKSFQLLRRTLRFLWALFILALFLPIWPIILLYNTFVHIVIIGILYYILLFVAFEGWIGMLLYFFIFCTATFLVSSVSVPTILRVFIYIKNVFSLERKKWREVNNEAKAAFLSFYLRIQRDRKKLLEKIESRYEHENPPPKGGIYYLFLKTIHGIKDYILSLRKKKVMDLFEKMDTKIHLIQTEISEEKREYEESISQMKTSEIIKTTVALLITFLVSGWIAMGGSHGHGLLVSIFLSFIDQNVGTTVWWNYEGSGMGYYEYIGHLHDSIPGFVQMIMAGIDYFWGYFFRIYYYILPTYSAFIIWYYQYVGNLFSKLFWNR